MSGDGSKKTMTEVILGPNNRKKRKEEMLKAELDPNYVPDIPPKKTMTEVILGPDNRKLREIERQRMLEDPTYVPTVPPKKTMTEVILGPDNRKKRREEMLKAELDPTYVPQIPPKKTMTEVILGPNNRKKRKEEEERLRIEAAMAARQAQVQQIPAPAPQQAAPQPRPRVLCPYCGGENDNPYRFCSNCGKPSPQVQPLQTEPVEHIAAEPTVAAPVTATAVREAPVVQPVAEPPVQAPEPVPEVQAAPVTSTAPVAVAAARTEETRVVERPPVAPIGQQRGIGFSSRKREEEERMMREARLEEYRASRRAAMAAAGAVRAEPVAQPVPEPVRYQAPEPVAVREAPAVQPVPEPVPEPPVAPVVTPAPPVERIASDSPRPTSSVASPMRSKGHDRGFAVYHAKAKYLESMEDYDGMFIFTPGSDSEIQLLDALAAGEGSGIGRLYDDRDCVNVGDPVSLYFVVRLSKHRTMTFDNGFTDCEQVRFDLM